MARNSGGTGPNPGDTNVTAETQTGIVEVWGTPADGQVPVWNAANSRFEWGAGSGGSAPVTLRRAEYRTIPTPSYTSADSNYSYSLNSGGGDDADPPLDLTDPLNPVTRRAGIFAFGATVINVDAHAGDTLRADLSLDDTGFGWVASQSMPLDVSGSRISTALTVYLPAGAACPLYLFLPTGPLTVDVVVTVQEIAVA